MLKTILLSLFLVGSHHFETVTPTPSPTINRAPQLKGYEIGTQAGTEDEVFEFDVPVEDIFYDDGELTYSASEATKEALPTWLAFNDESYSFFGLPSDTDIGRYNISLTATDQGGLESSTYFLIEIMGQSENKDTLSSGGITGIILGLLAAISPCIVDGVAYARWRIKKKTEEEEDGPSSLLTCENYRSECCKGKFKFLNCYNKCDGCCSTVFSCLCDDCCKACCKDDSCNCCVKNETSYHHSSGNDKKELKTHHTNNEQNLTIGGNITASNGGVVNIDNSNKSNNSTQNTHVKNDHSKQVINNYHQTFQVVKNEKNTTSNQRLEHEKLKIEIENLRNQLKDKDTKLSEKSQQLNEKNDQLNELKSTLKKKDVKHQQELKKKAQEKQVIENKLNKKKKCIETLSNQLKDGDTKLDEKSQKLNKKDNQLRERERIITDIQTPLWTALDNVESSRTIISNPLVCLVGVSEYDTQVGVDLPSVREEMRRLYDLFYFDCEYEVTASFTYNSAYAAKHKDLPKMRLSLSDLNKFLNKSYKKLYENIDYYDGLIFVFSGHGFSNKYNCSLIATSDCKLQACNNGNKYKLVGCKYFDDIKNKLTKLKKGDLKEKFTAIPKIFFNLSCQREMNKNILFPASLDEEEQKYSSILEEKKYERMIAKEQENVLIFSSARPGLPLSIKQSSDVVKFLSEKLKVCLDKKEDKSLQAIWDFVREKAKIKGPYFRNSLSPDYVFFSRLTHTGQEPILVLGIYGDGKTTFTYFMAGHKMQQFTHKHKIYDDEETYASSDEEDEKEHRIIDLKGLAVGSENSRIRHSFKLTKDTSAHLSTNKANHLLYCDCPWFLCEREYYNRDKQKENEAVSSTKAVIDQREGVKAVVFVVTLGTLIGERMRHLYCILDTIFLMLPNPFEHIDSIFFAFNVKTEEKKRKFYFALNDFIQYSGKEIKPDIDVESITDYKELEKHIQKIKNFRPYKEKGYRNIGQKCVFLNCMLQKHRKNFLMFNPLDEKCRNKISRSLMQSVTIPKGKFQLEQLSNNRGIPSMFYSK